MEVTYPRFVHSEFMTHRMFSRNAASSRAIPIKKMIEAVLTDPVLPVWWGANQAGMQAAEELPDEPENYARTLAETLWLKAREQAVETAQLLSDAGLHKQIVNRVLEPWMWITVIASATDWENFFHLRCHPDAQPELRHIANLMEASYRSREPKKVSWGEYHLPLTGFPGDEELDTGSLVKVSVGRCARVSYLTHDGLRDPGADISLHDRLAASGHWSPFEHVAYADQSCVGYSANFASPWRQYRKEFASENFRG